MKKNANVWLTLACLAGACAEQQASGTNADLEGEALNEGEELPSTEEEVNAAMNLVGIVNLPNEVTVRFYEPEPGAIVIRESGRVPRQRDPSEIGMRADELYELLSGEPAPDALVDALGRNQFERDTLELSKVDSEAPAPQVVPAFDEVAQPKSAEVQGTTQALAAIDRASFQAQHCGNWSGWKNYNWLSRTGESHTGQEDDREFVASAARPYRGNIRFVFKVRRLWTWNDLAALTVPQGQYESVYHDWNRTGADFDAKGWVNDSEGDGYDFCTHFKHF